MKTLLIIISILLIAIVLLQSGKAESASNVITGGADLFANRKERGIEVVITRTTLVLSIAFMVLCAFMGF